MSKTEQRPRPEARLPKGLSDISAPEIRATEDMLATIRTVFESYGFEPLDSPAIEYSDALGKFLPDQDRPNEGVFSFQDDDEQWLSLRYDLTAPLARYVAENFQSLPKPFRRYQVGPVWRNEKPGPGRFRQFTQFDADTVGASTVASDAELCMLAADTLEALSVKDRHVVKVNNRKLLDGLLETIGLDGDSNLQRRLMVLRAIDKFDRLGADGVKALLGKERKDESGDVTKGAELPPDAIDLLMSVFVLGLMPMAESSAEEGVRAPDLYVEFASRSDRPWCAGIKNSTTLAHLRKILPRTQKIEEGLGELETIASLCETAGYDRVLIDPSVVRGLEYYTGPVFEAELTTPIKDERGQPIRLGSVVSGGRYDGLVERFTGEKVPATGVSIGVSRLLFGLQLLGKYKGSVAQGPVVVLVPWRADCFSWLQCKAPPTRQAFPFSIVRTMALLSLVMAAGAGAGAEAEAEEVVAAMVVVAAVATWVAAAVRWLMLEAWRTRNERRSDGSCRKHACDGSHRRHGRRPEHARRCTGT